MKITIDKALSVAKRKAKSGKLSIKAYTGLLDQLPKEDHSTFTLGLANREIKVEAMADYKSEITKLKRHFQTLAKRQGCVYENDYHEACYHISDPRVIGEINMWLAGANLPLRKQVPKSAPSKEYEEDVKNKVKHPNINKMKATAADTVKTNPAKDKPKVEKGIEKNKLNEVIKDLREGEDEFLPFWKKFDEKKLASKKVAQRIDEEKRRLSDTVRAWTPAIPNVEEWVVAIENADDFSELQRIWEELWGAKEPQESRPTEEYREFVDLDTEDGEELDLDLTPKYYAKQLLADDRKISTPGNPARKKEEDDPVEDHVSVEAKQAFDLGAKKIVSFKDNKFVAYVATTDTQKAIGLEAFDSLKANEGMLFPFDNPQHVTFHMGSVKFPIDIIFLMDTSMGLQAAKIVHNVEPGDLSRWAHNNTAAVLELPGGSCRRIGVKLGSIIEVDQ